MWANKDNISSNHVQKISYPNFRETISKENKTLGEERKTLYCLVNVTSHVRK